MSYLKSALEWLHNLFARYPLVSYLHAGLFLLFLANRALGLVDVGTLAGYVEVTVYALGLVAPSIAPNGAPLLAWAAEVVRRAMAEAAAVPLDPAQEAAKRGSAASQPSYSPLAGSLLGRVTDPDPTQPPQRPAA